MKKIVLAIGLLSSTANANLARHRFSCTEAKVTPENAQSFSFFEVDFNLGSYLQYFDSKKQVLESIDCEKAQIDGLSFEDWWTCRGEKVFIHIIKVGSHEFQGSVYDIQNGNLSKLARIFPCH